MVLDTSILGDGTRYSEHSVLGSRHSVMVLDTSILGDGTQYSEHSVLGPRHSVTVLDPRYSVLGHSTLNLESPSIEYRHRMSSTESVAEQDGKIDTLQCLHEGLRRKTIDRHPSFPIPGLPANATSLLLHQSIPPSMSSPESPLPPLIDLSMERMAPTPQKFQDASAIEGLLFEYN